MSRIHWVRSRPAPYQRPQETSEHMRQQRREIGNVAYAALKEASERQFIDDEGEAYAPGWVLRRVVNALEHSSDVEDVRSIYETWKEHCGAEKFNELRNNGKMTRMFNKVDNLLSTR